MRRKDRRIPAPSPVTGTAERLNAIVEAAERAAAQVIDDAEEQARRHLEQAEAEAAQLRAERSRSFAELADSAIAQAEELRRRSDQLLAALEELKAEADAPPARGGHLKAVSEVESDGARGAGGRAGARDGDSSAGARLLATQMAVSGSSRQEIETRLRSGFEIEDTASILDAILGPEE